MFRIPDPNAGDSSSGRRAGAPFLPFTRVGPLGLVLVLGVVVLAVVALQFVGKGTTSPEEAPGPDRMVREPRVDFLDDGAFAEQYPTTASRELEGEITSWFQTPGREVISDRTASEEPEWVRHLLSDSVRPRLERLPGWVFGEIGDLTRLVQEPGPARGRLVQAWGAVRSIDETLLPTEPETPAWRIRLDDPEGRSWTIVSPRAPPPGTQAGSWVKGYGVFVKLCPLDEGRVSLVVLTPRSVVSSFPPKQVEAIDPAWAEDVHDDTMEASQRKPADEDAFWLLMNYVDRLGPDGYRRRLESGELKVTDLTGPRGATDLAQQPALHRFELVRLRVAVVHAGPAAFTSEADMPENPGNVRAVSRGYVMDDQQRTIWVLTPRPIAELDLGSARLATVDGFFYKRMAVQKRDGGLYYMPVLVATAIRPVELPARRSDIVPLVAWTAIFAAFGCVALFVYLSVRSRRQEQDALRRHAQRASRRTAGEASVKS